MTTPPHGYVPAAYLAPLSGSTLEGEKETATAFAKLRAAHPLVHINGPAGAYWSHDLSVKIHSSPAVAATYGISASEFKLLAGIGLSPHELGTRLNFSGVTAAQAAAFGFTEFNAYTWTYKGPYSWDLPAAPTGPGASTLTQDEVKRVATYLNGRAGSLGHPTSTASSNGIQGPLYWTLVQAAGNADGLYPTPAYKINGVPGTRTYWLEEHYRDLTAPAAPTPPPVVVPPADPTPPVDTTPPVTDPTPPVETDPTPPATDPVDPPVSDPVPPVSDPAPTDPVSTDPVPPTAPDVPSDPPDVPPTTDPVTPPAPNKPVATVGFFAWLVAGIVTLVPFLVKLFT